MDHLFDIKEKLSKWGDKNDEGGQPASVLHIEVAWPNTTGEGIYVERIFKL